MRHRVTKIQLTKLRLIVVAVFVMLDDSSPIHKQFCRDVLGVFNHQLRAMWDRKVYSGTGQAPLIVSSLDEMHTVIEQTPGAVGYRHSELDKDELDDEN